MKSKVFKLSGILLGVMFFLAIFGISPIVARASEELYFDNDGNLYYITREIKASSSTKYYTIGWIIKRYDMPIDVPGQQYVIVTKSNYKPDMVDPEDSKYVYCYYKSDKEEILSAVRTVSSEWYLNLQRYGDTVYIDSVMTVLEDGVQQGFLYQGGEYTGEVYFDYEGIAGARSWASPESLKVNFDMSVEFPVLYMPMAAYVSSFKQEWQTISSSFFSSSSNGSDDYDIENGIPSGEKMYIKGSASKVIYMVSLKKATGQMTIDVKVPVTYILKWTDYYGVEREETRVVNCYYTVKRPFSYYSYDSYTEKKLTGVQINSTLFSGEKNIPINISGSDDIDKGSIKYGYMGEHMLGYDILEIEEIGPIVLTSDTYLKPSIPSTDYSSYAEEMIGQIKVRSDKVVIDGKEIMSDEIMLENACSPVGSFTVDNVSVQEDNLIIDKNTKNGSGYIVNGKYIYEDTEGSVYTYNMSGLKTVVVHTPVVCNSSVNGEKELNQAVNPTAIDAVLGTYITLAFNDFGVHRNIKGYGTRSYASYVRKRQVRCEFDVMYKGVTYEAGTWIDTKDYYLNLYVCEDNKEGKYKIETRTVAYNGADNCGDNLFEAGANLSVSKYGASASREVRLIGRIEGLTLCVNNENKYPTDMPYNMSLGSEENESREYILAIETVGDIGDTDYLEVHYNYYVRDELGEYVPVWVYEVESRDVILGERLNKLPEVEVWNRDNLSLSGNKGVWQKADQFPTEFMVVKEGVAEETLKQAIVDGSLEDIIIKDKNLYVAVDFVRYKDGEAYISYVNEENSKKGYCNMWLREGGGTSPYGIIMEVGLPENMYYDYEISGTH